MAQKQSSPEIRGAAFSAAREKCAMSVEELAHLACLSKKQIQQIENGQGNSFYSPAIKLAAARKVANLIQLDEKDAFDFGPQAELPLAQADELTQNESKPAKQAIAEDTKPKIEANKPAVATEFKEPPQVNLNASPKSDDVAAIPKQSTAQAQKTIFSAPANAARAKPKSSSKAWVWLLPACALAIALVQFQPLLEEQLDALMGKPKAVEATALTAAPVDTAPATPPAEPVSAPAAATSQVAPAITTSPAVTVAANPACPLPDASIENYKSPSPNKPGNMVYIKVSTAQIVCVEDGDGKVQSKTMEPGLGYSFYGKPPLKLMTSGLSSAEVFFQGFRVRPSNPDLKSILLVQVD